MSGSDKLPNFERFHSDLRYFGHDSLSGPSTAAAVPPPPHPFIAHFYPLSAGTEPPNVGYPRPANSISQPSSAAALVALAASGCVAKNLSSHILRNFQKQTLQNYFSTKEEPPHVTSYTDDPPNKKIRQQFDVESLTEKSPPPASHNIKPSNSHQNISSHYPGISSLNSAPIHSAWQQILYRFRNQDKASGVTGERSGDFNKFYGASPHSRTFQPTLSRDEPSQSSSAYLPRYTASSSGSVMPVTRDLNDSILERQKGKRAKLTIAKHRTTNSENPVDFSLRSNSLSGANKNDENPQKSTKCDELMRNDVYDCDSMISTNGRSSSASSDQSHDDVSHRRRRKRFASFGDTCPVCGITVRPTELFAHMQIEIEKLQKIPSEIRKKQQSNRRSSTEKRSYYASVVTNATSTTCKRISDRDLSAKSDRCNRSKTYQKVRSNRVDRLNTRVGQCLRAQHGMTDSNLNNLRSSIWSASSSAWSSHLNGLPANCPVCCVRLIGTLSEMHEHIGRCLRQKNAARHLADEDCDVDVENHDLPLYMNGSGSSYDDAPSDKSFGSEYEWCGQTRVRATSLADRSMLASSSGFFLIKPEEDSEKYLNVDTDDTQAYGPTQFVEENLVTCEENTQNDNCKEDLCVKTRREASGSSTPPSPDRAPIDEIAACRLKIEQLETERRSSRCMICMEQYKEPVTSIQCWHVHCESCWMRALAVKKLCPQCNAITPPDKLRRIYL